MAYGAKYICGATAPQAEPFVQINVLIEEKDYTGGVTKLKTNFNTFRLTRDFNDIEQNVMGTTFQFQIINEGGLESDCEGTYNHFYLDDLMFATERQFRIKVVAFEYKIEAAVLFEGFLNTENTEQKYLQYQSLKLVASSYLTKLKDYTTTEVNISQDITFIDLISSILREMGSESDIRINCSLLPEEDYGLQIVDPGSPGYSLFNKVGCMTELFWKNNIERVSSFEILSNIMLSFNCYIYWWDEHWYIEAWDNIWISSGTQTFVEYDINTQYSPTDYGIWRSENRIIEDVHSLQFMEMSQIRRAIAGLRQIAIKVDDKKLESLTPRLFSPMLLVDTVEPVLPNVRQWARYEPIGGFISWTDVDAPYKDIFASIKWNNSDVDAYHPTRNRHHGLYCDFRVTIKDETSLVINWKYSIPDEYWLENAPDDLERPWRFFYGLRIFDADGAGTNAYLAYNPNNESLGWYLSPQTSPTTYRVLSIYKDQKEADQDTHTMQLSVTIPLKDINKDENTQVPVTLPFRGDFKCEVIIGLAEKELIPDYWRTMPHAWYGDIDLDVIGNEPENNYIEGTINTDFLNKKEITMLLADNPDYGHMNGILRGDTLEKKTRLWRYRFTGDTATSLVDRLLINKFRFYNVTRQRIEGNIHTYGVLWKPFMLFEDSKQANKKFIVVALQHRFDINAYDIALLEYDNETVVNLLG